MAVGNAIELTVISFVLFLGMVLFARRAILSVYPAIFLAALFVLFRYSTSAIEHFDLAEDLIITMGLLVVPMIFGTRADLLASTFLLFEFLANNLLRMHFSIVDGFDVIGASMDLLLCISFAIAAHKMDRLILYLGASIYLMQILGHAMMLIMPGMPNEVYMVFRQMPIPLLIFFINVATLVFIARNARKGGAAYWRSMAFAQESEKRPFLLPPVSEWKLQR
ncbi:hypothetical protein [Croceicoccus gelatinilyticus]|uniref:hypothetical protein n=1 Tax=Croceicoccus gelatinilyticus TaxID=2835536 RepID=UPI001BCE5D7C|nr:hypothetical protein [Croceicoccus gelatinilyticus]MBS7671797.1 hypothetical protein [Croceicoccus gelatinilyticus]